MIKHNAALRGECRLNQLSAYHFHHQKPPQAKNATRHESLLNALLCTAAKQGTFNFGPLFHERNKVTLWDELLCSGIVF